MKRRRNSRQKFDFCSFEERICLTVAAAVNDAGSLHVRGDADGPVTIVATGENTFDVTDNGETIGTFEGVTRNLVVDPKSNSL